MADPSNRTGGPSAQKPAGAEQPWSRARQAAKFLTAGAVGTALLVMSGLTLAGTVVGLALATPVLVVFSPVLVPAAAVALMAGTGLLISGGFGVVALSALAWIYNYAAGKHPRGADKLDSARAALSRRAHDVKERAKDYGHYVQHKAQVTAGASES